MNEYNLHMEQLKKLQEKYNSSQTLIINQESAESLNIGDHE